MTRASVTVMRNWALSRADVTLPDGTKHEKVSLLIQSDEVSLRQRNTRDPFLTAPVDGDSAIEIVGRNAWQLTMGDGSVWQVVKSRGCNCGSR